MPEIKQGQSYWRLQPWDELVTGLVEPGFGQVLSETEAKALAVHVALRGVQKVAPNPLVGAVICDATGRYLASGAHEALGCAHAEINALKALRQRGLAPELLKGASMYVTLEPCSHVGRTPACAPEVIASGIKRVVYGLSDPNPKVNGSGIALLRQAELIVETDSHWQAECAALAEVFLINTRLSRPAVGIKVAASLDGVIARHGDQRAWISSARSRQYGHFLRLWYDAVLVGAQTMIADDPELGPRDAMAKGGMPWRLILDPKLRAASCFKTRPAKVFNQNAERVAWCAFETAWQTAEGKQWQHYLAKLGATILAVPNSTEAGAKTEPMPLTLLLDHFKGLGIHSVLVEGGAGTYRHFFEQQLVDRLHLFQAPLLMGTQGTIQWATAMPQGSLRANHPMAMTALGPDVLLELGFATAKAVTA